MHPARCGATVALLLISSPVSIAAFHLPVLREAAAASSLTASCACVSRDTCSRTRLAHHVACRVTAIQSTAKVNLNAPKPATSIALSTTTSHKFSCTSCNAVADVQAAHSLNGQSERLGTEVRPASWKAVSNSGHPKLECSCLTISMCAVLILARGGQDAACVNAATWEAFRRDCLKAIHSGMRGPLWSKKRGANARDELSCLTNSSGLHTHAKPVLTALVRYSLDVAQLPFSMVYSCYTIHLSAMRMSLGVMFAMIWGTLAPARALTTWAYTRRKMFPKGVLKP